jgi:hypothetical protein
MSNQDNEAIFGEAFEQSFDWQRSISRYIGVVTTIAVGSAVVNYFIEPTERLEYTALPITGSIALFGLGKVANHFIGHYQDALIAHGIRNFDGPTED